MTNEELRAAALKSAKHLKSQTINYPIFVHTMANYIFSTVQPDDGQGCFAWQELSGAIDLDSIAETQDGVRFKILEGSMGWRFEHPSRYNQNDEWKRLQAYGSVVPVVVRKLVEALGGR